MTHRVLLQITTNYCCAAIAVEDGIVVEAAPILRWTIGKTDVFIYDYFTNRRNYKVEVVKPLPHPPVDCTCSTYPRAASPQAPG